MSVFVIAECGSNWRFGDDHLSNAYRMIRAAKECGADAAKFQWVSDYRELMKRRGETMDAETERIYSYVHFPAEWLPLLKAECERIGIQFGVTCYLPQDVRTIFNAGVDFWKVAAKEADDKELRASIDATLPRSFKVIVSHNSVKANEPVHWFGGGWDKAENLWCVSKYPCPIDEIKLSMVGGYMFGYRGLSDHTAHVLTGAVAVGAGARIIESHVRLHDTPSACPDYPHSLYMPEFSRDMPLEKSVVLIGIPSYREYVENVRTASRML